ncbi:MAG: hypothetical protein APF81_05250 [Desulfosporosinus sp. BRH_c37]|nr:MAG: hypothetical protein APF81_05250 [Desulfosporosinus sp. BRH_c37]
MLVLKESGSFLEGIKSLQVLTQMETFIEQAQQQLHSMNQQGTTQSQPQQFQSTGQNTQLQ